MNAATFAPKAHRATIGFALMSALMMAAIGVGEVANAEATSPPAELKLRAKLIGTINPPLAFNGEEFGGHLAAGPNGEHLSVIFGRFPDISGSVEAFILARRLEGELASSPDEKSPRAVIIDVLVPAPKSDFEVRLYAGCHRGDPTGKNEVIYADAIDYTNRLGTRWFIPVRAWLLNKDALRFERIRLDGVICEPEIVD
jgi:hypothetical protein